MVIITFFLILFLFVFSGLIIDSNLLVGISQAISYSLPFTYAFDALRRTILLGRPLLSLTFDLEYLIGSIIVSFALAFVLLHTLPGEVDYLKNDFVSDTAAITTKELKQLRRDPVSLILTVMFPIILIGIFIVIVAAFSATTHNVPVVVADLDGTPASNAMLNELTRSRFIHVTQLVQTEDQAYQAVNNAQAVGAIIIPQGFGNALLAGDAFVIVSTDNSKLTSSQFVVGAVNQGAQDLVNQVTSGEGGINFGLKIAPIEVITRTMTGRPPSGDPILPGFLA